MAGNTQHLGAALGGARGPEAGHDSCQSNEGGRVQAG